MNLLIFGLGYSGIQTAIAFYKQGYRVSGTVRNEIAKQKLKELHPNVFYEIFIFNDGKVENDIDVFESITHVVVTTRPLNEAKGGILDPVLYGLKEQFLRHNIVWVGYLSTIAVYGDTDGKMADEEYEVSTNLGRGLRRIVAERNWMDVVKETTALRIFRLPGIYGKGRGALDKAMQGTAKRLDVPDRVFHRIHVQDISSALLLSAATLDTTNKVDILNLSDDEAGPGHEMVAYACKLLKVDLPPLLKWDDVKDSMSPMAKSFYAEGKRISNEKMKSKLGLALMYPNYRVGLANILKDHSNTRYAKTLNVKRACIVLNTGSLRPEPFLDLRKICFQLSSLSMDTAAGEYARFIPASCRHSNKIDPSLLHGVPAETLNMALKRAMKEGFTEIHIIPMFFGPSKTLETFVPEQVNRIISELDAVDVEVHISSAMVTESDNSVARILMDKINMLPIRQNNQCITPEARVFVIDHGTPSPSVHLCREIVGNQLREMLGKTVRWIYSCSSP